MLMYVSYWYYFVEWVEWEEEKEVLEGADQGRGVSYVARHTGQVVCRCCITDDCATDSCSQRWL